MVWAVLCYLTFERGELENYYILLCSFFGIDVLNIYHTESLEMGRQVKFKINATKRALPHTSTLQCKLSVDLNAQMRCTQLMKKIAYSDDVLNCKECL